MASAARRRPLEGQLVARARTLFAERNRVILVGLTGKISNPHNKPWWMRTMTCCFPEYANSGYLWHLASNPDAHAKALFDLAAEVVATVAVATGNR